MYQLEPNVCFNEENDLNNLLINVNDRWRDRDLPLQYLQFINGHYDSLEQQIQNSYEINTGVILFSTPEKIFCINLNDDNILLTSIEPDQERYTKSSQPHFILTHFNDKKINEGWFFRIVVPIFNLFWRQILRSVSKTFNVKATSLVKLIDDCPIDSDFQLISPENCFEYEDKDATTQIINSKVTQFPLFLYCQEKYNTINLNLNQNTNRSYHYEYLNNFISDQLLCKINGLINDNKIPFKYKSEEFKNFSLVLSKSFKYWRQISDMDIFFERHLSKEFPFIPICGSFKDYNQEFPNKTPDKLFEERTNCISDIEDIERIAFKYGYEFKKVLGINLSSIHFTTHTIYYINGYYEQVLQKIAIDEFIDFQKDNLDRVAHLLKHLNPLIQHFEQAYPNDENLVDFFELKKHLDQLYSLAEARYSFFYYHHYDTKEIDVV